jgi:S1-C subfamily serine protease
VIASIVSRRRSRRRGSAEGAVKKVLAVILAAAELPAFASATQAQSLDEIFTRVSPSVVVVRSKGRDVSAEGVTRFNETGSGVLISSDGRVMTAAHVVRRGHRG